VARALLLFRVNCTPCAPGIAVPVTTEYGIPTTSRIAGAVAKLQLTVEQDSDPGRSRK